MLADKSLPIEDRIKVRKELAQTYLWKFWGFEPEADKDAKTSVLSLYNEILNDPELKQDEWFETKCAMADMYRYYYVAVLGVKKSEAKAERIRLYNELVEDKKLTPEQKKKVRKIIEVLEKTDA